MHVGFSGAVEVLSAYRSPTTDAWLPSVNRGVAATASTEWQRMDISMPAVPAFTNRQAYAAGMGGVGFYPALGLRPY